MTSNIRGSETKLPLEKEWKESRFGSKLAYVVMIIIIVLIIIFIVGLILGWDAYFKDHLLNVVYSFIIIAIVIVRLVRTFVIHLSNIIKGDYVVYRKRKYPINKGMIVLHPTVKITSLTEIEGLEKHRDLITCLDLSNNNLTTFEGLENLPHLEILNASHNALTSLANVPNLPALKSLNLCHNKIRQIETIASFSKLESLDLSENYIREIRGLESLPNLKIINLSKNFIEKMSGFEVCPQLIGISLSQNQISIIENIEKVTNLRTMNLSKNKIAQITGLERLFNLQYFAYQHNLLPKGILRPRSPRGQSWVKYCQLARGPAVLQELRDLVTEIKGKLESSKILPQVAQGVTPQEHFQYIPQKDPLKVQFEKLLTRIEKRIAWLSRKFNNTTYNQARYRMPPERRPPFNLRVFLRQFRSRVSQNLQTWVYKVILVAIIAIGDIWLFYFFAIVGRLTNIQLMRGTFTIFLLMSAILLVLLWILQHHKKVNDGY